MSDSVPGEPAQDEVPPAVTAGGLLRQARQARGLHIAALATSIKVSPQKLELLETDRIDELPGATFTRALAQTICRSLKIDAAPVLALLPQPVDHGLEQMSLGLNAPFRERPGRRVPTDLQFLKNPVMLAALALVAAAVAVYLLPAHWLQDNLKLPESIPSVTTPAQLEPPAASAATDAASGVGGMSTATIDTVYSPPSESPVASEPSPALTMSPAVTGALQLRVTAESWVEVIDGRDRPLLSRMLQPGEAVGLDGVMPLSVRIGNASATKVTFKGKTIELSPSRDNVAKLELK